MGAYLDAPKTEKNPENGKTELCSWGACSMQGWRCGMEDSHIATSIDLPNNTKGALFGVFDGHGGKEVAIYAKEHFTRMLIEQDDFKNQKYEDALYKAFMQLDLLVEKEDYARDTGSTACVVLITTDKIYCANSGDSRGVMKSDGKPKALSEDHKPDNFNELSRIKKAHHIVEDSRVDGNLALSRAFGDFQYKDQKNMKAEDQAVTAKPDIFICEHNDKDDFIMLACDGIWDCLSNQECIDKCTNYMKQGKQNKLSNVVEKMFDDILAPNTDEGIGTDNMTAIIIHFKHQED